MIAIAAGIAIGVPAVVHAQRPEIRPQPRPLPQPSGPTLPEVWLTTTDQQPRKVRLVNLSENEVIYLARNGVQVVQPLTQVRKIKRVTHYVRDFTLLGLGGGFVLGYLGSCGGGDEEICWPEVGALIGGIGAGVGAVLGISEEFRLAPRDVLYPAAAQPTVRMTPVIGRQHAGISFGVTW